MNRIRGVMRVVVLVSALALGGCMAGPVPGAPGSDIGAVELPIVDGTRELGRPEVVFLYNLRGAACTGTVISPYVVLTANHCIEVADGVPGTPNSFRVYVGSSTNQFTAEYRVAEVRPVPNAGLNGREPNDVALVVLATAATETPMALDRRSPTALFANTVTSVGYGQTPTGGSGVKFTTTTTVQGYQGGFIFVDPSVCSGDSGGPLINDMGTISGVASFIYSPDGRTSPRCGTAPGAYNEIFRHLGFIDSVLEETGTCVPEDVESCNGEDDNCDGVIDEGCIEIGQPCERSDECFGGLCADTVAGRICTSECDPLRPSQGCGLGFYCGSDGCTGNCVPGEVGTGGFEDACSADTDCLSLFCRDPGDGVQRCLEPCQHDAGLCLGGEVCVAAAGSCGSCVSQELFAGRGAGEPCDTHEQCGEGRFCFNRAGVRECAIPCGADGSCAERFSCREGLCLRDRTQGVGGVCEVNEDCGEAICAALGDRAWCTVDCSSNDDCPTGFECQAAGAANVCAPATSLDGESCTANSDCASLLCANAGSANGFCTQPCDADNACGVGLICQRIGAGSRDAVCVPPPEVVDEGGCSVRPSGEPSPWAPALFVLVALGLVFRRR